MEGPNYAKIAYDAYCNSTGGVSLISGDKLPDFDSLRQPIKDAWKAAAMAVVDAHIMVKHNGEGPQ